MFIIKKSIVVTIISVFISMSAVATPMVINTDIWPPYINKQNQPTGIAAKVIELIARNANKKIEWQYIPYEMSLYLLGQNKVKLAFPYFKTAQRSKQVLFSDPIFTVTSYLYYNRQYLSEKQINNLDLKKQRIGKVAGYSYGERLDKTVIDAEEFNSEEQALLALLNNDIELLPMTEEVMNNTLQHSFPERVQLIKPLADYSGQAALYLIANKSEEGEQTIALFNQSLQQLKQAGIQNIQPTASRIPKPTDLAKLITSEGYPAIIGQSENEQGELQYFTLPNGTKVVVMNWSDKMLQASSSDRLYKNMMDLSQVVILNGPHVGRVLFVRNMHIELF